MTPIQAITKSNEKEVYSNLQDQRVRQQPKFKLGQSVGTVDIKGVFSKKDSTNYSYILKKKTEGIHDIISSYRVNFLFRR